MEHPHHLLMSKVKLIRIKFAFFSVCRVVLNMVITKSTVLEFSHGALDLEVGSDIIETILTPSDRDLIALVVIVAIRIVLSWSLSREVKTT